MHSASFFDENKQFKGYLKFTEQLNKGPIRAWYEAEFGEYAEPIARYANLNVRGTGVIIQPRKADGKETEAVFILEDKSEVALDAKAKKFSYNGKAIEPPAVNDLFRKSWYEWRAKHGRKRQ